MYNFSLRGAGMIGDNSYERNVDGTSKFQQEGAATVGTFGTTIRDFGFIGPIDQGLKMPRRNNGACRWNANYDKTLLIEFPIRVLSPIFCEEQDRSTSSLPACSRTA
jgi:hypothetical protein